MNPLQEVIDYLEEKIDRINVNNPKANKGCVSFLESFELDYLPALAAIDITAQIMQANFTKTDPQLKAGQAKLTAVSSGIGHYILPRREDLGMFYTWERDVTFGDIFIEAFLNCDFIEIHYEPIAGGFYYITVADKWVNLYGIVETTSKNMIRSSVFERPSMIDSPIQQHVDRDGRV